MSPFLELLLGLQLTSKMQTAGSVWVYLLALASLGDKHDLACKAAWTWRTQNYLERFPRELLEIWQPKTTRRRRRTGGCLLGLQGSFRKGVNKPGEGVVGGKGKEKPGNTAGAGIAGPVPSCFTTNRGSRALAAYQTWAPLPTPSFLSRRDFVASDQGKIYAFHSPLWEAFVLQLNWKLLAVINYQSCALCPLWFGCSCSPHLKPWLWGEYPAFLPFSPASSILMNAPGIPPSPSSLLSYCFGLWARLGSTRQRLLFNPRW